MNPEIIRGIGEVCRSHKGSHKLKMQIYDKEEDVLLSLVSRAYKVHVDTDFIEALSGLGVKYRLN